MRKKVRLAFVVMALLIASAFVWNYCSQSKPGSSKPLGYGKVRPQFMNYGGVGVLVAPDGSLWSWGEAFTETINSGEMKYSLTCPLDDMRSFETPRRVGTNTDWAQLTGNGHEIYTLKTDGTLYHWMITSNSAKPVQIGPDSNWRQISWANGTMLALKTDGSVWSWHNDTFGMPGYATNSKTNSPVMVGTEHDWRAIEALFFDSYAIKNDGSLWSLSHSPPFKPIEIGNQSNWLVMSGFEFAFSALRADGVFWWKGVGDFNREESGVHWTNVYPGNDSVFARKEDGSWWGRGENRFDTFALGHGVSKLPRMTRLPYDFEAWAFAPGLTSTLLLTRGGKLWSWGNRMGKGLTPTQRGIRLFIDKAGKKLSFLYLFSPSVTDHVPHLVWELPPEVRVSLTNDASPP